MYSSSLQERAPGLVGPAMPSNDMEKPTTPIMAWLHVARKHPPGITAMKE